MTFSASVAVADDLLASVTLTVSGRSPGASLPLGVPEMTPLLSSFRPLGNAPMRFHFYGGLPPPAASWAL